jgi:ribonuclease J
MRFRTHRIANETGYSYIEIWTDRARIVIDPGISLSHADKTPLDVQELDSQSNEELVQMGILPDIPSLYEDNPNTAVLVSHPHRDHYALLSRINPLCKVFIGFGTHIVTELINNFNLQKLKTHKIIHYKHAREIHCGDFHIVPYLMDNNVFDSYVFLIDHIIFINFIETRKTLIYSGDFRLHGRESANLNWFCGEISKKNVDYMFLEGSTNESIPTEEEIEEQFIETFKQTKGNIFIFTSNHNIDRLKTIYEACRKCVHLFLVDSHTANLLKNINKRANSTIPFISNQRFPFIYKYSKTYRTINKYSKPVGLVQPCLQNDIDRYFQNFEDGCFIYSMDPCYKEKPGRTKDFLDFIQSKGMPVKDIHSSNLADLSNLKKMADALKPKNLVLICTSETQKYKEYFSEYNVITLDDKEEIIV